MIYVLFTSEYELFSNGRGCPLRHMVEPTDRMIDLLDDYGAKLTLYADVPEIIRFGDYYRETGRDDYSYEAIVEQLRKAVKGGHDVQLHLHASYFSTRHMDGYWHQHYPELDLAQLPYATQVAMLKRCRDFLDSELTPAKPDYRCFAFRAASWSMQPSQNIVKALSDVGFTIDSSVWKYGRFSSPVRFDYRRAHSDMVPWPVSTSDVCDRDSDGPLFEFPIYSESQPIWRFLSPHRIFRALEKHLNPIWNDPQPARRTDHGREPGKTPANPLRRILRPLVARHALKMDFNHCIGRQLLAGLRRAESKYRNLDAPLPFVIFGHSRTFTRANAASVKHFLKAVSSQHDRFRFGVFGDFELEPYRRLSADVGKGWG